MEEPPRIEKIKSSQGVSLSDAASILQSFIETLENKDDHGASPSPQEPSAAAAATSIANASASMNGTRQRKSRQEMEEEAILKQFDLLSQNKNTSLVVSDDTYERLKLIRDSIMGEVTGKILLPSAVVKKVQDGVDSIHENGGDGDMAARITWDEDQGEFTATSYDPIEEISEEVGQQQQLNNELNEAEKSQQTKEERRRAKKQAKKEKKSAKKAKKKEAREQKKRGIENGNTHDGLSLKRIKLEES